MIIVPEVPPFGGRKAIDEFFDWTFEGIAKSEFQ